MQIDIVRHSRIGMILQMELDRIPLSYSNEAARYCSAEGPECISYALGDFHIEFANFHIDDNFRRVVAIYRGRNIRCRGEDSLYGITLRRPEITGRGASCVCLIGCIGYRPDRAAAARGRDRQYGHEGAGRRQSPSAKTADVLVVRGRLAHEETVRPVYHQPPS